MSQKAAIPKTVKQSPSQFGGAPLGTHPGANTTLDVEVCQIKGLMASINSDTGFTFLNKAIDKWTVLPTVNGFLATVEEQAVLIPKLDAKSDEVKDRSGDPVYVTTTQYPAKMVAAGLGNIGNFPSGNCGLSDDAPEDKVANPKDPTQLNLGMLPIVALNQVPGVFVKYINEVSLYAGNTLNNQDLNVTLQCSPSATKPVCQVTYQGPQLDIPLPRYITFGFDVSAVALRKCANLGCKQATKAVIDVATYKKDSLDIIEACSITGVEGNVSLIPFQEKLVGAPDIQGAYVAIDPAGAGKPGQAARPVMKKLAIGAFNYGKYPTNRCNLGGS